jgi:hypothetical protein
MQEVESRRFRERWLRKSSVRVASMPQSYRLKVDALGRFQTMMSVVSLLFQVARTMFHAHGEGSLVGHELVQRKEAHLLVMEQSPRYPSPLPPPTSFHTHHHALLVADSARRGYSLPVLLVPPLLQHMIENHERGVGNEPVVYWTRQHARPCLSTLNSRQLCSALK